MKHKPGMRVRCVDAGPWKASIRVGAEYTIAEIERYYVRLQQVTGLFFADRFRPIVRVKALCVPSLDLAIKRAVAAFDALTPEEQAAHRQAQRESWVRGEMGLSAAGLG